MNSKLWLFLLLMLFSSLMIVFSILYSLTYVWDDEHCYVLGFVLLEILNDKILPAATFQICKNMRYKWLLWIFTPLFALHLWLQQTSFEWKEHYGRNRERWRRKGESWRRKVERWPRSCKRCFSCFIMHVTQVKKIDREFHFLPGISFWNDELPFILLQI